jgi:hypothetical protein
MHFKDGFAKSARHDYFSAGYAFFLAGSKNGVLTIFAGAWWRANSTVISISTSVPRPA